MKLGIGWQIGWSTWPKLYATVPQRPPKTIKYQKHRIGPKQFAYVSQTPLEKYYLFADPEHPGGGFGGNIFEIPLVDGTTDTLIGPGAGGAYLLNHYDLGPVIDVSIGYGTRPLFRPEGVCVVPVNTMEAYIQAQFTNVEIREGRLGDAPHFYVALKDHEDGKPELKTAEVYRDIAILSKPTEGELVAVRKGEILTISRTTSYTFVTDDGCHIPRVNATPLTFDHGFVFDEAVMQL